MRTLIIAITLIFSTTRIYSQEKLPFTQMINHLVTSNELSYTNDVNEELTHFVCKKYCGNAEIALYVFSSSSVHHYEFLLIKNKNKYQILNCDNFISEWATIDITLSLIEHDLEYYNLKAIIELYVLNSNYHPTPPYGNLKKLKDSNGNLMKSTYPPRKLVETSPFIFNED